MLQALCFCELKPEMTIALDDMGSFYIDFKRGKKEIADSEKDGWW